LLVLTDALNLTSNRSPRQNRVFIEEYAPSGLVNNRCATPATVVRLIIVQRHGQAVGHEIGAGSAATGTPVGVSGGTGWLTSRHGARLGHHSDCPAVEAAARFALAWAGMITALVSGAFLGFSCGLAPGPMLALVLAQTLRHGPREGCKIALTPLVTDAPIITVALAATGFT
jgi:hypothetical protein